jgi:hypothetical protein
MRQVHSQRFDQGSHIFFQKHVRSLPRKAKDDCDKDCKKPVKPSTRSSVNSTLVMAKDVSRGSVSTYKADWGPPGSTLKRRESKSWLLLALLPLGILSGSSCCKLTKHLLILSISSCQPQPQTLFMPISVLELHLGQQRTCPIVKE